MPPVWLIAALAAAWALGRLVPVPAFGAWAAIAGPVIAILGAVLLFAAAWQFRRAKTSIIPGDHPNALISSGVYRWSRNPIYLADAMILAGAILYWRAILPLILLPLFVWIIRTRFILPEEARVGAAFPQAYAAYMARTRRWI